MNLPHDICYEITLFDPKFPLIFYSVNNHYNYICKNLSKYSDKTYCYNPLTKVPEYAIFIVNLTVNSKKVTNITMFKNSTKINISNSAIDDKNIKYFKNLQLLNISNCKNITGSFLFTNSNIDTLIIDSDSINLELVEILSSYNVLHTFTYHATIRKLIINCENIAKEKWLLNPRYLRIVHLLKFANDTSDILCEYDILEKCSTNCEQYNLFGNLLKIRYSALKIKNISSASNKIRSLILEMGISITKNNKTKICDCSYYLQNIIITRKNIEVLDNKYHHKLIVENSNIMLLLDATKQKIMNNSLSIIVVNTRHNSVQYYPYE